MKANITKEVKIKGLEISLETEEEVKTLETILAWAQSWVKTQVNPHWEGRVEVIQMISQLQQKIQK